MPTERELLATDFTLTLESSTAILAHNLAKPGTKVGFITRLRSDSLGAIAIERLTASGVDVSRVVRAEDTTATGITVLLHHGESRHILTYPGTMTEMTCADLDFDYLVSARHFHRSSLFLQLGLHPDLPQIFGDLKRAIAGALSTLRSGGTEAFRDPSLWKPFLKKHEFAGLA